MSDIYYCSKCQHSHRPGTKIWKDHIQYMDAEPDTSSLEEDMRVGTNGTGYHMNPSDSFAVNPEPEPKGRELSSLVEDLSLVARDVGSNPTSIPGTKPTTIPGTPSPVDTEGGETPPESEASPDPQNQSSSSDEAIIESIMSIPETAALMMMIQTVNSNVEQFKHDMAGYMKDVNDSIEYLKAVPGEGGDLMRGFDRFVEKFGLGDVIKQTLASIPRAIDRATGGDPLQSELGGEFMEEMIAAKRLRDREELGMIEDMRAALRRGETLLTLRPEDVAAAEAAGILDPEG